MCHMSKARWFTRCIAGALGTACIFAVADSAWIKGTVARVVQDIMRTLKAFSDEHVVSVASGAGGAECV